MFEKRIELKLKSEETAEVRGIKDTAKEMLKRFYARVGRIIKSEKDIEKDEEVKDMPISELEPKPEGELDESWDEAGEAKETFPDKVEDINLTEYLVLVGSSRVRAGYFHGELLVVKKACESFDEETGAEQLNTEQLVDEYIADRIYEAMGFDVPVSKIYDRGKYKIAKFVPGKDLSTFYEYQPEFKKIKKELQKGFILDCLLANDDVIGTGGSGGDNIRLGDDGKVYRLDNGGALRFRARGGRKGSDFSGEVGEIDSLKAKIEIFSDISDDEMIRQLDEILRKYDKIFGAIGTAEKELNLPDGAFEDLKIIIEKRIEFLVGHFRKLREKKEDKTEKGVYESAVTNNYFEGYEEVEFDGANPGIKEQIRENIMRAEEINQEIYKNIANSLGISVEQFKVKMQAKIENMVKRSEFFRATHVDVMNQIMNVDGRWKSQFETGKSSGTFSPDYRAAQEMRMFGFNRNEVLKMPDNPESFWRHQESFPLEILTKDKERRPIYGYFSDDEHGAINERGKIPPPTNVNFYGSVNFRIKKERALKKATITFNDSLTPGNNWPPTPAVKPHFASFETHFISGQFLEKLTSSSVTNWGSRYTEVQYHGQLTMDDVESIHLSTTDNGLTAEDIEEVRRIFEKYKQQHPESTIQLIEF